MAIKTAQQDDAKKLIDSMLEHLKTRELNYSLLLSCDDSTIEKANNIAKGKVW